MNYLLIEDNEPGQGATVTICSTAAARNRATLKAIYGAPLRLTPDMEACALSQLMELKEHGVLHFEGDPSIRWMDACAVNTA